MNSDLLKDFFSIRKALKKINLNENKIINNIIYLENVIRKNILDKNIIGSKFEQIINYLKKNNDFYLIIDQIENNIKNIVFWLDSDWEHIYNLLRSRELGFKYPIIIEQYKSEWIKAYHNEVKFLKLIFSDKIIIHTEHFGSTSVPGLASKPVIDVLIEIPNFKIGKMKIKPELEKLEYTYNWLSNQKPGHIVFYKGYGKNGYINGVQLYHIHMAPRNHQVWERIYFRDFLIKYPDIANDYQTIKIELAKKYKYDREEYTIGKEKFIKEITEKAKIELK